MMWLWLLFLLFWEAKSGEGERERKSEATAFVHYPKKTGFLLLFPVSTCSHLNRTDESHRRQTKKKTSWSHRLLRVKSLCASQQLTDVLLSLSLSLCDYICREPSLVECAWTQRIVSLKGLIDTCRGTAVPDTGLFKESWELFQLFCFNVFLSGILFTCIRWLAEPSRYHTGDQRWQFPFQISSQHSLL